MSESKKELPILRPRNSSIVSLKDVTFSTEYNPQPQIQSRPASAPLDIIKPQKLQDSELSSSQIDPSSPPSPSQTHRKSFQFLLSQKNHPFFNPEKLNPHFEEKQPSSAMQHVYADKKAPHIPKTNPKQEDTSDLEGVFQFDL